MVVCKFFQQGSCRYGQSCRFEHIYSSKYSYHAPSPQPSPQSGVTDEQLVNQVQGDIQSALKGGQWVLSCYAPFKEKPNFPGISDLSPEEARLFIYEAKANNNVEQAVSYMNNMFKETIHKYEQVMQPNQNIIKLLRSLYKGEAVSSPFTSIGTHTAISNTASSNNAASSIFRSAVQSPQASVFGQTNSVFNQNPIGQNVFGAQSPERAKSIFAQANQSFNTGPSIFAPQTQMPTDTFPVATQPFGSVNEPSNIFANASHKFFGSETTQNSNTPFTCNQVPSNVFQISEKPSNVFGSVLQQTNNVEQGVYSKMQDLSQDDLDAYKSDSFVLGFIPFLPPPCELCI